MGDKSKKMEVIMKIDDILVIVFMITSILFIWKFIHCCIKLIRKNGILAFFLCTAFIIGAIVAITYLIQQYIDAIITIAGCIFLLYILCQRNTWKSTYKSDDGYNWWDLDEYDKQQREYYDKHFGHKD